MLKTGLASLASAAVITPEGHSALPEDIKPKAAGETKVVFLGGDELHNFATQEPALRGICEKAGWKFYGVHDSRYVTPKLIGDADLMIVQRWHGGVRGWTAGPVHVEMPTRDDYLSDELEAAIIDNVVNRGMGFMSNHCTIAAWGRPKFFEMLGVIGIIHGCEQLVHLHDFNQDHPITKGITDFDIPWDENFGAQIINDDVVILYEATGNTDKRHDVAGWCLEQGNGRVVGLTAGHTFYAYRDPTYLEMYRRAAYWAMKRDIPSVSPAGSGGLY
jgi:type 1 glutamine amidotransferase